MATPIKICQVVGLDPAVLSACYQQQVSNTDSRRGYYSPPTCISSPRLPGSVTILSHHSTTVLAVVAEASSTVRAIAGIYGSEGAILAAASLGAVLPNGTGGSTLDALKLPAPVELDEAWEASGKDQLKDDAES